MTRIILILLFIFSSQSFADTNSEKCEQEAKMLKLIEMVQQDLPKAKLIINQDCLIEVINRKELTSYKVNNYEDLLYLYKVKFFNNKINAAIELNSGDNINFENVKDLNETEFFKLPIKGKGHKMRMRKLKKEFLVEKKKLG